MRIAKKSPSQIKLQRRLHRPRLTKRGARSEGAKMGWWTEDRDADLKELWKVEGLTASHIAERIGAASRCAVLGRAQRLGLRKTLVRRPAVAETEKKAKSPWTKEKDAELRKLWEVDGLSARGIADAMGDVSRNAVIGRLHRLGINERTVVPARREKAKREHIESRLYFEPLRPPSASSAATSGPTSSLAPLVHSILYLSPEHCRYPYDGDEGFRLCGRERKDGSPYCAYHHRLCHSATQIHKIKLREEEGAKRASAGGIECVEVFASAG
jgi:GcrA cell cycle regulator